MSESPDTAPVADGNSANVLNGRFTSGLDQSQSDVDSDLAARLGRLETKLDSIADLVLALHGKMDDQRQGIVAVYNGVDGLVKMLSVVQQVASTMPFGKKMSKAIDAQMNGGNTP